MNSTKPSVIRKSNELIEAKYSLSTNEQRFILSLLSNISTTDEDFKDYQVKISDFADMFDLQASKSLYERVEKAANSLVDRTIIIDRDNKVKRMSWLSYLEYEKGSGVINLRFDKALKPYLLQLKKYTQYNLECVNFKGKYSYRFYEFFKKEAFKKNGSGEFYFSSKISYIRDRLEIPESDYTRIADFKRWVIEPSVKEIDEKSDVKVVSVDYVKSGRKIESISFICKYKKKEKPLAFYNEKKEPLIFSDYAKYGIAEETIKAFMSQGRTTEELENTLSLFEKDKEQGKIKKNEQGYLITLLASNAGQITQAEKEEQERKQEKIKEEKIKLSEEKQKEKIQMLEKSFLKKRKSEYLESLSEKEKSEIFEKLKANYKENPFIHGKIDSLSSPFIGADLANLVKSQPDYTETEKAYIESNI